MNSPLGQYAPLAATGAALAIIGVTLFALLFGGQLGVSPESLADLKFLAALAAGAVFGSAVSVNGWKQPLAAAHLRADVISSRIDALATATALAVPEVATTADALINHPDARGPG